MTLKKAVLGLIAITVWMLVEIYFPIESSVPRMLQADPNYPPLRVTNVAPVPAHDH